MPTTVLLIDDDESLLEVTASLLGLRGLDVHVAATAAEAQAALLGGSYDAIIADINMPQMTGPQLFEWMRARRPSLTRHVIFMSGDSYDPEVRDFMVRWATPCLQKPMSTDDLVEAINQVVFVAS